MQFSRGTYYKSVVNISSRRTIGDKGGDNAASYQSFSSSDLYDGALDEEDNVDAAVEKPNQLPRQRHRFVVVDAVGQNCADTKLHHKVQISLHDCPTLRYILVIDDHCILRTNQPQSMITNHERMLIITIETISRGKMRASLRGALSLLQATCNYPLADLSMVTTKQCRGPPLRGPRELTL